MEYSTLFGLMVFDIGHEFVNCSSLLFVSVGGVITILRDMFKFDQVVLHFVDNMSMFLLNILDIPSSSLLMVKFLVFHVARVPSGHD